MARRAVTTPLTILGFGLSLARWLTIPALLWLSLHHWTSWGYWERSGAWNFGLILIDPRTASAALQWVAHGVLFALVLPPAADRIAARIPAGGALRWGWLVLLALGLGTRGIVGPLLMRAALASPLELTAGGDAVHPGRVAAQERRAGQLSRAQS